MSRGTGAGRAALPEPELVLGPVRPRRRWPAALLAASALGLGAGAAALAAAAASPARPIDWSSVVGRPPERRALDGADGASVAEPGPVDAPFDLLERVRGDELDGFHAALARTAGRRPGAVTRVLHLGDSSIGLDQLTHGVRRRFQERFGDAGAGFVLLQPHSASYRHLVAPPLVRRDWDFCYLIFRCRPDGHYGLGGVTVRSAGGAETAYQLPRTDDPALRTRFELYYALQPDGGSLLVDWGEQVRVLATASPRLEDARFALRLPRGTRRVAVSARGGGVVRAYGVVLEHERPGVVWDGLSMIGAFTHRLLEQDPRHLAAQVRWRDPDLVVLSYGGNDLRRYAAGKASRRKLAEETRAVLRHVRRGAPGVACLVMGINDHRRSGRHAVGPSEVEAVLMAQRLAARAEGCAFFDTYRAMGGRGAFERWQGHRPPLVAQDGKHLTGRGRSVVARRLYDALLRDHERYRGRRLGG